MKSRYEGDTDTIYASISLRNCCSLLGSTETAPCQARLHRYGSLHDIPKHRTTICGQYGKPASFGMDSSSSLEDIFRAALQVHIYDRNVQNGVDGVRSRSRPAVHSVHSGTVQSMGSIGSTK